MCKTKDTTTTKQQCSTILTWGAPAVPESTSCMSEGYPVELRIQWQGTRAGAMMKNKKMERRWRHKPCPPSVVIWNVRSLTNKMDELSVLVRGQLEYWECRVLCLTETWLNRKIPDCSVELASFSLVWVHREKQSGKTLGVADLLSLLTPNGVTQGILLQRQESDVELLAIRLRPCYLVLHSCYCLHSSCGRGGMHFVAQNLLGYHQ